MNTNDMRQQLFRIGLRTLLALFLIPGLTLGLAHYFKQSTDREYTQSILASISGDSRLSDGDKATNTILIQSNPPSTACFSDIPGLSGYRKAVCEEYSSLWQFVVAEKAALWTLLAGALLLVLMTALGVLAFAQRRVQYLSFVIGWRVLVLASAAEIAIQGVFAVWLSFWITVFFLHSYFIKLIAIVGIMAAVAVFAAIVTIFRRARLNNTVHGELVAPDDAPRLWSRVRELAAKAGTAPPEQIITGIDANFFVTEQPLQVGQRTTRGRTLFVSIPMLRVLDQSEADAVLAHELGHFAGGDTASSAALGPKLAQYDFYTEHMRKGGATVIAFFLLILYRVIFEIALSKSSREREFAADSMAQRLTSSESIARALVKVVAYGNYRADVEKQLFAQQRAHSEELGIGQRVANGLAAFSQSADFARIVRSGQIPHPFDSHPPLTERMRNVGYELPEVEYSRVVSTPPTKTWVDSIDGADDIEGRLWQEFERQFSQAHEEALAYRFGPKDDYERELVLRYFPPVIFPLKKKQALEVAYDGMSLPGQPAKMSWDRVKALRYEDVSLGADRLTIVHPEKGTLRENATKVSISIPKSERKRLKEVLGKYWQRHQIMRAQQAQERSAQLARDAFPK